MSPALFRIAAALCFLAVALGAFGAVALVAFALHGMGNRGPYYLLLAGIFFFSGSLYLMALTNVRWLGAITPIGGLCFLAGWTWLIITPPRP